MHWATYGVVHCVFENNYQTVVCLIGPGKGCFTGIKQVFSKICI